MTRYTTAFVTLLFAFSLATNWAAVNQGPSQTGVPVPAPPGQNQEDLVIAKVLGESITEKEVLAAIDQIAGRQQLTPQQTAQKEVLFFSSALDSVVATVLLRNDAREKNLAVDGSKIEEAYQGVAKRFPSEEGFKKALQAQGLTEQTLRKTIEDNMLVSRAVDAIVAGIPGPSDEAIQRFYGANPQYFEQPEAVHAAHILLKTDPNSTPEQKAEIKMKLEGIRADIEGKKVAFAAAAVKESDDKVSAQNGGDLGFLPRGRMVKPFEDAAFTVPVGTISPVIETQLGYHLIQVIEKKAAGKASLAESKEKIRTYLDRQSRQAAIEKYVAGLRDKTKVELIVTEEQWSKRHPPK